MTRSASVLALFLAASCLDANAQQFPQKPVRVKDEGTFKGSADTINCTGAGITCAVAGNTATLNVTGGGGGASPGGLTGDVQVNDGLGGFGGYTGTSCAYAVKTLTSAGTATCTAAPTIPTDISGSSFITRVSEANLSNETAMGSLGSGLVLNTTTTGVPTIYTGSSCSYAVQSLNASGVASCQAAPTLEYQTVQANGASQTQRPTLNLISGTNATVSCADNAGSTRTDCTVSASGGAGGGYSFVKDEGVALAQESTLNFLGAGVTCVDNGVNLTTDCTIPGGGTDLSGEPFITKTASANLSNEFALGSLATGILKNTTTTGVPTIAVSGTDYAPATSGSVLLLGNGAGGFTNYGGATSCTNQFFTGLSTTGASTCTTDTLASAQHANQGTTTTVLHGNAAGNPSFGAVTLTTDVTGVLPLANGGTNANLTAVNGAVVYSTASAHAHSAAGTAGQVLLSGGAGAPTWGNGCLTLGTANGATTTVGPVTWAGTFNTLYINYEITGYNGGTPVGRILMGSASISTTALTNGSSGYEGVAGTLTNMLSIPGAPLAVTLSSIGRAGTFHSFGRSGAIKRYWIEGQNGNASVSAASTVFRSVGNFSDLGTNLPLQRAQLTVYDTLTATAASAQTFNSGTTITVIGCP